MLQLSPHILNPFRYAFGFFHPNTCIIGRLLGPCFKTGRVDHRPFARRESRPPRMGGARLYDRRRAARTPAVSPTGQEEKPKPHPQPVGYQSVRAFDVPKSNGSRRPTVRRNTPADAGVGGGTPKYSWVALLRPHPADSRRAESPSSTFEVPPVWLLTVSRTLELSLQSSFQLSLTVLVLYRSRGHI